MVIQKLLEPTKNHWLKLPLTLILGILQDKIVIIAIFFCMVTTLHRILPTPEGRRARIHTQDVVQGLANDILDICYRIKEDAKILKEAITNKK